MNRIMLLLILCLGYWGMALSDDPGDAWDDDDHSHDQARRALARGEILPMETLLARVKQQFPGEVIDVEFEKEHGHWVYEFKIIDPKGRLLEIYIDASNGQLLAQENE